MSVTSGATAPNPCTEAAQLVIRAGSAGIVAVFRWELPTSRHRSRSNLRGRGVCEPDPGSHTREWDRERAHPIFFLPNLMVDRDRSSERFAEPGYPRSGSMAIMCERRPSGHDPVLELRRNPHSLVHHVIQRGRGSTKASCSFGTTSISSAENCKMSLSP